MDPAAILLIALTLEWWALCVAEYLARAIFVALLLQKLLDIATGRV